MLKKSSVVLLFCISLALFMSCNRKEKVIVHYEDQEIPGLKYKLQIPEYTEYPELSKIVQEGLENDFTQYKDFATSEWENDNSYTFTYRTIAEDFSNKDYINVFIKKYIYCGPSMEDEYFITYSWDKKQKRLVSIEELTGMTSVKLMDYCQHYIKTHLKYTDKNSRNYVDSHMNLVMNEDIKKYSHFVATKKLITIYFAPGDSAPKGYGPQVVEIKRK